jgi:hypothetical protein
MSKNNLISGKGAENGYEISFFENNLYWLWIYFRRIKAASPWSCAQAAVSGLKFASLASIFIIVLIIIDVSIFQDFEEWIMILMLLPVLIQYDRVKYRSKKYCVRRVKYGTILNEEYCILAEMYEKMPYVQRRRRKRIFLIYTVGTILTAVVTWWLCPVEFNMGAILDILRYRKY